MTNFNIEVLTIIDNEEIHVGWIGVYQIPRVGEYLWFSKKRLNHTSWIVVDVAHHIGDGELNVNPYQNVAIYAEPVLFNKES